MLHATPRLIRSLVAAQPLVCASSCAIDTFGQSTTEAGAGAPEPTVLSLAFTPIKRFDFTWQPAPAPTTIN